MQKVGNISSQGILCLCWGHFSICKDPVHSPLTLTLTKAFSSALLTCWGLILPSLFTLKIPGLLSSLPLSGRWHSHCLGSMYSMWPSPLAYQLAVKPVGVYVSYGHGDAWYIAVSLHQRGQGKQCHVVESQDHLKICLMRDLQIAKNLRSCNFCTPFWCIKQARNIFQGSPIIVAEMT